MNRLIKMVLCCKLSFKDELFNKIMLMLDKKIEYYVKDIETDDRDDVIQNIINKIYKLIHEFKMIDIDLEYIEFIKEFYKLKNNNETLIISLKNFYFAYEDNIDIIFNMNELYYEYNLYCNENQFKKYINKLCENSVNDYYREKNRNFQIYNLYNDLISMHNDLNKPKINRKDLEFINMFYNEDKRINEVEVSKKLGVSKQAINKRKKELKINIISKFNILYK